MRPVVVETTLALASAPADVWPFITDTDRSNRLVLGTSAVYKPIEKDVRSSARFVVTANETIDYFGQTVKCAARVQHLADSGQVVLEEELYDRLPDADRAALVVVEKLNARVKGVDEPLRLVRCGLAPADGAMGMRKGG